MKEYMPYPIALHMFARQLTKVRKDGTLSYLETDGKTQVNQAEYDDNGKAVRSDAVVLLLQHDLILHRTDP